MNIINVSSLIYAMVAFFIEKDIEKDSWAYQGIIYLRWITSLLLHIISARGY